VTTPAIPAWEWTALEGLSSAGDLFGLNPIIVGSIDQAESSGGGGGINSSGYGGWFGLSSTGTYPGGEADGAEQGTVTPSLLDATTPAAFTTQAEISAAEFASLLAANGGNAINAEEAYQGGQGAVGTPSEGSAIVGGNLGTSPAGGNPATLTSAQATDASLNLNPLDLFGIPATGASAVGSDLSKIASALWGDVSKFLLTMTFAAAGLALVVVGIKGLADEHEDDQPAPAGAGGMLPAMPAAADDVAEAAPLAAVAA
jgi:hypothetical protein